MALLGVRLKLLLAGRSGFLFYEGKKGFKALDRQFESWVLAFPSLVDEQRGKSLGDLFETLLAVNCQVLRYLSLGGASIENHVESVQRLKEEIIAEVFDVFKLVRSLIFRRRVFSANAAFKECCKFGIVQHFKAQKTVADGAHYAIGQNCVERKCTWCNKRLENFKSCLV